MLITFIRKAFFLIATSIALYSPLPVYAGANLSDILNLLIRNNLLDEYHNSNQEVAKAICEQFHTNSFDCMYVSTIGEAICKASNGNAFSCHYSPSIAWAICQAGRGNTFSCQYVTNLGESICYAGGGDSYDCMYVTTIREGIEKYNEKQNKNRGDYDWAWDQFYHSSGSLVWACRGIQTGRFAEKTKCYGKPKHDNRWPNK